MQAFVVENDPRISWLTAGLGVVATGTLLSVSAVGEIMFIPSTLGFGLAAYLLTVIQSKEMGLRRRFVEVSVSSEDLVVGGKRIQRKKLHSGFTYILNAELPRTTLYGPLKHWSLRLEMVNEEDGLRLLEQLDLAPWQTTTDFALPSLVHAASWRVTVVFVGNAALWLALGFMAPESWGLYTLGLAAVGWSLVQIVLVVWPSQVKVGADGVLVRWLLIRRFIGHSEINAADLGHWRSGKSRQYVVCIATKNGRDVVLPLPRTRQDGRQQGRLLVLRLRECSIVQDDTTLAETLPQLDRNGTSPGEWFSDLRTRARQDSYRIAAVTLDRLMLVIEDSRCPADRRGAAAVVAMSMAGPDELERMRIATSATAHEELRHLLDGVALGVTSDDIRSRFIELVGRCASDDDNAGNERITAPDDCCISHPVR